MQSTAASFAIFPLVWFGFSLYILSTPRWCCILPTSRNIYPRHRRSTTYSLYHSFTLQFVLFRAWSTCVVLSLVYWGRICCGDSFWVFHKNKSSGSFLATGLCPQVTLSCSCLLGPQEKFSFHVFSAQNNSTACQETTPRSRQIASKSVVREQQKMVNGAPSFGLWTCAPTGAAAPQRPPMQKMQASSGDRISSKKS